MTNKILIKVRRGGGGGTGTDKCVGLCLKRMAERALVYKYKKQEVRAVWSLATSFVFC